MSTKVSKLIAELSPEQREMLSRQLREKRKAKPTQPVIAPRDASSASAPLSFHQERLWFLAQYESGSPLYNLPAAVRLTGPLNPAALEQSFNEIIARHESLRTIFSTTNGQVTQSIHPVQYVELTFKDLSGLPVGEQDAELQRLIEAEACAAFDLAHGPLVRLSLLHLEEEKHVALFTMHHIISDGWSIGIFIRELAAFYESLIDGRRPSLPALPIQYADFAIWQRGWLRDEVLESELAYWKQQLSGIVPMLQLPTDRPRPASQTSNGAKHPFVLSPTLSTSLRVFCQQEQVTVFMLFVAALQVLLHRYSGQDDIVIGTPVAGRYPVETEALIGYFVNTLALRMAVTDQMSFRQLLKSVREMSLEAFAHQRLPFEKLVDAMDPARDLSHTPLLQVWFVLHNTPAPTLNLRGLKLEPLEVDTGTAKFDLSLSMVETPRGFRGSWIYNTDLFNAETIVRISGQFQLLLDGIAKDPERNIASLPLLSQSERQRLIVECSATILEPQPDRYLHQLFEEQVERVPDAVAIEMGSERFTYRQLNQRANQLAHHFRSLNIGPEKLVGICMERSLDVIVGLLGTLKAGGAYVPLDPQLPEERLAFMMEDARARVLLTQSWLLSELPAYAAASEVVCLDSDWDTIAQQSDANLANDITAESLAYVIYTSGSTGRPKGVCVSHQAAVDHCLKIQQEFALSAADRVLQFASFNFDVSLEQILPTLFSGATLVLRGPELWTVSEFQRHLNQLNLTVVNLPTAYWHQLAKEEIGPGESVSSPQLRLLIIGGDLLLPESVKLWQGRSKFPATLLNAYGPTETAITASLFVIPPNFCDSPSSKRIPIGRPLSNRSMFVLDRNREITPIGVPGELYIGGPLLARGYLNRPDLTAERFCPDPFSQKPGARLYRTGDMVRYLPDANIEFLGRVDDQVKIRGYRIELGEVEAALVENPSVREAVVLPREDVPGEKRLVAYVVGDQGKLQKPGELRLFLKKKLPEYMLPSAFVMLDKLPLSPNGKVDRAVLPAPSESRPEVDTDFAPPGTMVEEVLAGIWAEILGLERVGVNDDFFDLGGHSLLATQVVSRVRESFGVEIPLRKLFESPTVASLAECVEAEIEAGQDVAGPPIQPRTLNTHLPLSFAQQRLWYLNQLERDQAFYNMLTMVELSGPLNVELLKRSLSEVVRRHEVLRTNFRMVAGEPEQVISPPAGEAALSVRNLIKLPQERQDELIAQFARDESARHFDLEKDRLARAILLVLAEDRHLLLLTFHHIVADAWSFRVLLQEVAALYQAYANSEPSPLPNLSIQYADYALWEQDWLRGERLQKELEYWRQQLAGAPAVLELPTDYPRPATSNYRGQVITFTVPHHLLDELKAISRSAGATLFMTLLGAWQVLLARYTGQFDISVGSPVAGRDKTEVEQLVGFFVNTLVMRTDLSGDPSFKEVLDRVREVSLNAYVHQQLPFEKLVEVLQPERQKNRNPLFQVMFVLQNTPMPELQFGGLKLRPLDFDSGTAKFDLTLDLAEGPEGLKGWLEYSTDLFEAASIERMARHFQTLLEDIVAHPERPISQLQLLPAEERAKLMEWNQTGTPHPKQQCIHELFEAQVERSPDQIAVVFENEQLSYQELNERSTQLARHLRQLGVGPESRVGLCVERSLESVVGVLGILKAGAAYVPLDPHYPSERLSFMLEDADIRVLLTHQAARTRLPEYHQTLISIDEDWETIIQKTDGRWSSESFLSVSADNLAYIIYTSGSTGTPKGVMVTHANVLWLFEAAQKLYHFDSHDVWTLFHSYSLDFSVWELFGALLHGGRLVVVPYWVSRSPVAVRELLHAERVTVLNQTPSAFRELMYADARAGDKLESNLRVIMFGGEALGVQSLRPWFTRHGHERPQLVNMFGITETTVHVTYRPLTTTDLDVQRHGSPIGRPLWGSQTYLLDQHGEPVPIGVAGEIHVGGAGLTRGYAIHPELTAERFVPNPFSNQPGERLYRTSDLARYLPNGDLEFLGRLDEQVKIRGSRIEFGEVEAALSRHEDVREAVVAARTAPSNSHLELIAYVAVREGSEVTSAALRGYLKQHLPDYIIPTTFMLLPELPKMPNGNLDRKALPVPDQHRPEMAEEYTAPRTPTEEAVARIWREVLGLEQVGVENSFFELGGHSLLAMRLTARIQETFQVKLSLHDFLDALTIRGVAEAIDRSKGTGQPESLPIISPVPHDSHPPLSFAQQRLWFLNQLDPENPAFIIPAYVQIRGHLNAGILDRCFNEIVQRHEALRATFATVQGEPVQTIVTPSPLTMSVIDLREFDKSDREGERQRLIRKEAQRSFDLAKWPLFRAVLVRLEDEEYNLLFSMHHIISDGRSCEVLLEEIIALYEAFSSGLRSPLAKLPIQYSDFAVWQLQLFQGEVLERHLSYWRKQLNGAPELFTLPGDRPRPAKQSHRGGNFFFRLPADLSESLRAISREENVTLFMTVLAVFEVLLHFHTKQNDVVLAIDDANRTQVQAEKLIGFFINQLVIRNDLSGNPGFRELLRRVRQVTLEAYAYQDLPFDKLVEALQPERSLQHAPLCQVKLSFEKAYKPLQQLTGLKFLPLEVDNRSTQLDLILFLEEHPEKLIGCVNYSSDLYDASTIARLMEQYEALLQQIVQHPEATLSDLEAVLAAKERERQHAEAEKRIAANIEKLKGVRRPAATDRQRPSVMSSYLSPGEALPLVLQPNDDDLDLVAWTKNNLEYLDRELLKHGAILFRGFNISSAAAFEQFALAINADLFTENGEHQRSAITESIYTPVFYPPDKQLLWHNENSFNHSWPMKIWFHCVKPADIGGETPVVDSRKVFASIDPQIREEFARKQITYVRNYIDGLGLKWQSVFRTEAKVDVEEYCRRNFLDFEWKADGDLRTRCVRPAVLPHPRTGEMVWFNQAQHWHPACLDEQTRESLRSLYREEDLPRNCYYGDGSRIEDDVMKEICKVYRQLEITFPWQPNDILMLDNLLTAHGRNRYSGERKLFVAMGEMSSYADITTSSDLTAGPLKLAQSNFVSH